MKKTIITSIFALLLLASCSKNEMDKETNFMDGWELAFSGWELDFTKPYVQNFSSQMQRDSIITALSDELFEVDDPSVAKEDAKIIRFSLEISAEDQTVTTHLIDNQKDISKDSGILISSCLDEACMNEKIIEILAQNPNVTVVLKKDLYSKEVQLWQQP